MDASVTNPLPEPTPAPAEQPAATSAATPAAAAPATDPYADFADLLPKGVTARDYIRETLQVRRNIDATPGGLDALIQAEALEVAPGLAEELLRSPKGREIAARIAGAAQAREDGEPLEPEDKRLLDMAEKLEALTARTAKAEALAQSGAILQHRAAIHSTMESEFAQAMKEQPEMEEFADEIRERIGLEGKANPSVIEAGWTKRRALELHNRFSALTQKAAARVTTRGRAAGSSGGGAAASKDPTLMTREEAAEAMEAIFRSS